MIYISYSAYKLTSFETALFLDKEMKLAFFDLRKFCFLTGTINLRDS